MCLHEVDQEFAALAVVPTRVLAEAVVIRLVGALLGLGTVVAVAFAHQWTAVIPT